MLGETGADVIFVVKKQEVVKKISGAVGTPDGADTSKSG